MHHHRAEHSLGTAQEVNRDKTIMLSENESTYIPIGKTHSLSNPRTIPHEIIEVQSGSYVKTILCVLRTFTERPEYLRI